jgi:hypothetical protein
MRIAPTHILLDRILSQATWAALRSDEAIKARRRPPRDPASRHPFYGYVHVATRRRRPTIPSHTQRQRSTLYATERVVFSRVCLLFSKISNLQRLRLLGIIRNLISPLFQ